MEASSQDDFKTAALPTQAQARRLLDLAASGMGPLAMTDSPATRHRQERDADDATMALWELAQAVYRETQARILETFAIDDEASRRALAEIDELLAENAREQQAMVDAAAKMDDGSAIFLTEDGTAIYTEHGNRLGDDQTQDILTDHRPELEAGPSWEQFDASGRRQAELAAERAEILRLDQERAALRDRVEAGELSQDELEQLEADYESRVPERLRQHRDEVRAERTGELQAEEAAQVSADAPSSALARRFAAMADPALPALNDTPATSEPARAPASSGMAI